MEKRCDFVERLEKDVSLMILLCLEEPRDLAAVSCVSKSWRRFVIENGLAKQLCLKLYPDVSKIKDVVEVINKPERADISTLEIPLCLTRDHRVFSLLLFGLTSFPSNYQIADAICASSTDRYPDERIENTLREGSEVTQTTYWCSKGESDHTIPETLVYKLVSDFCLISEIHVRPYRVFWEPGYPIYNAESVRFSMGHHKSPLKQQGSSRASAAQSYDDGMFIWTYTSPRVLKNGRGLGRGNGRGNTASEVQRFQLPRPVICMGGILKIELLGRVQRQLFDDLYYISVSHVQAVGRSMGPVFRISELNDTGSCILNCIYGVSSGRD